MKKNGIKYIPIPGYHPSSNGAAEVSVRIFKKAMIKMCASRSDLDFKLANWLLQYRNTTHSITGQEPAVLMFRRRHRTALSLLNPLSKNPMKDHEVDQQAQVLEKKPREMEIGSRVLYRDVQKGLWKRCKVIELEGSKVLLIQSEEQGLVRKHVDHVVKSPEVPIQPPEPVKKPLGAKT